MKVPFNDLFRQYLSLKEELDDAISSVISTSSFISGDLCKTFERNFAEKCGALAFVSCGNGTDALYIALKSLKLKQTDEIIVPAHSWIATSEAVTQAGGKVVFCDTHLSRFTIDTNDLVRKINKNTVGVIPVHLFGQPANMTEIMQISQSYNLWILEDCAQAHLAKHKEKTVGTFGVAGTFSFYPGKNLGAMGDAGGILTSDSELATKMRMFSCHGGLVKGQHEIEGINSRLDTLQAAVLNLKLKHIEDWTTKRQALAQIYNDYLRNVIVPEHSNDDECVYHLYVIKTKKRDKLKTYLAEEGIQTIINYPTALPFLPAYKHLNHTFHDFPNAKSNQDEILSLPIFPEMTSIELEYVIDRVNKFDF